MARRSRRRISLLLVPVHATARSSGFSVPFALALFVHWAIEVGGICYEVTGEQTQEGKKVYRVKRSSFEEWSRRPGRRDNTIRHRVVGMTDFTDDELWYEARHIWKTRFGNTYQVDTQNCQNFAYVFYKRIHIDKDDPLITRSDRRSFRPFPPRLTRFVELAVQQTVSTVAILSIANAEAWVLYGAAVGLPLLLSRCKDAKWLKNESKADDAYLGKLYQGYNIEMVDDIAEWGFEVKDVVATLRELGYRRRGGQNLYLDESEWEELDGALQDKMGFKARYEGFYTELVDRIANGEFGVEEVVATMQGLGFDKKDTDLDDDEWHDVLEALKDRAYTVHHHCPRAEEDHPRQNIPLQITY